MYCERCGHQIPDGSSFCENCGAPVRGAQPSFSTEQPFVNQPYDPSQQPFVGQTYDPNQQPFTGQSYDPNQQPFTGQPYDQSQQPFADQPYDQSQQPYAGQTYDPNQQPFTGQSYDTNQQPPYSPAAPQQPKKPMSPKTKKIIIFSSIGAGVLVVLLIILFAVIIPAVNQASKADISNYLTVDIEGIDKDSEEKSVYDGLISGEFTWDSERFAKDRDITVASASALLNSISRNLTIEYTVNDTTLDSRFFKNASEGDTVKVTYKWPKGDGAVSANSRAKIERIINEELDSGVEFKHEDKTVEYKMGTLLSDRGITVKKPVEANVLGYIKEKDLVYADGERSGRMKMKIKPFETSFGEFNFKLEENSYYVYVKSGEKEIGSFEIVFDQRNYLDDNQTVTIGYGEGGKERLAKKGCVLTGEPITYTVKVPESSTAATTAPATTAPATTAPATTAPATTAPATTAPATTAPATTAPSTEATKTGLDANGAKANAAGLKSVMTENASKWDNKYKSGDKYEVNSIYYVKSKSSDYTRMIFVCYNPTQKYYRCFQVAPDSFKIVDSKVTYPSGYYVASDSAATEAAAKENQSLIKTGSEKFYDITKVA